jgi:XRE family aerobic/anaerobic benzoate catabolism transcriptional regulator
MDRSLSLSMPMVGCQGNIVHRRGPLRDILHHPMRPDILATLSQRARELRQRQQLTLRVLADKSGLSLRFLMDVEAGRGNISVRRLAALADALDVPPGELLSSTDDHRPGRTQIIALLGLRGAGKTTIGRRLARRRRCRFVELDREVERRAGLALGEIFSLHGEEYYRRLEQETLEDLLASGEPAVIAVGGGLVTSAAAYALLRQRATTIWLKARPEDYWRRVLRQGDRRPIDQHPHAREALRQLVLRRDPLYARADVVVDTTTLPVSRVVDRVERELAAH